MTDSIITIENISKKYKLGSEPLYYSLRDTIASVPKMLLKSARNDNLKESEFWALKNIDLEIERGQVLGLIGSNGAGKSTLLKILSKITYPTSGRAVVKGSIASLLEVGTGFSPELTGRENIFLNGSILGMSRKEIKRKFDEIVDFSSVEKFIDTPVKHYSSGMFMRLAFSVAAHLEPDILLVDEVLAVGDVEFQNKCLGKMDEITKKDGRTIIFVSHNMGAIQQLCTETVLLSNGTVEKAGKTNEVIDYYLKKKSKQSSFSYTKNKAKDAQIIKIRFLDSSKKQTAGLPVNEDFFIEIEYLVKKPLARATLGVQVSQGSDLLFISTESDKDGLLKKFASGRYKTQIKIPKFILNSGNYYLQASIMRPGIEFFDRIDNIQFEIQPANNPKQAVFGGKIPGKLSLILDYENKKFN